MAMLPTEKTRGQGQRSPWTCMKRAKKTKARGAASAPEANVMSDNPGKPLGTGTYLHYA